MTRFVAALACLLAVPGVAGAEEPPDDSARDEAIFGPAEDDDAAPDDDTRDRDVFGPAPGDEGGSDRDRDIFGGEGPETPAGSLGDRLGDRIGEAYDKLAIGGRLFLRLDYAAYEGMAAEDAPLSSPSLMDVYLDARPNDRVRAFAQGRLRYDFTVDEGDDAAGTFGAPAERTTTTLDQLWIKFDIARRVFVTFGRQPLRWGPGRFWNPTDFLNRRFKEPLEVLDERLGVDLLKLHVPIESLGWNLYAIADLGGAGSPEEVGGALRMEMLVGTTEIATTVAARREEPLEMGLSLSSGIGLVDVKAEVAVLHDVQRPRWEGDFALRDPLSDSTFPTPEDQEGDWIPRAVLGAEIGLGYGDGDAVYLGAEYFYNGMGYEDVDLYPWLSATGDFVPLYTGRHYAGVYGFLPSPGTWEDTSFILSNLGNLSDRSFLTRFDYRVRVLTWLDVSAWASVHYGRNGELNLGLTFPPIEGVSDLQDQLGIPPTFATALEQGLEIPSPLVNVGVGLIVAL
ncbi:MAG: hypothetical protein ACQEXJ_24470 [Myxococcota bacterium]